MWFTKATKKDTKALKKLRSFLDAKEPSAVKWLVRTWEGQQSSISYKELREAYLSGGLTEKQVTNWQKSYAELVNRKLAPQWEQAMKQAVIDAREIYPYYLYEPSVELMTNYIATRGAELVTNLAIDQKKAVQAIIKQASGYKSTSADEIARLIRPAIGLTKPQTKAYTNLYETAKKNLQEAHPRMTAEAVEKKARETATKYAAKQHRYRAFTIARTELASAYNAGHYGATLEAIENGYLGTMVKVVATAADERTCPSCGGVEGESQPLDKPFRNGKQMPPFHPNCRCCLMYEEIEKPAVTPEAKPQAEVKLKETKPKATKPKEETKPQAEASAEKPKATPVPTAKPKKPTATAAAKPKTTKPKSPKKETDGMGKDPLTAEGVFGDLSKIPKSSMGTAIASDSTKLEGQSLTAKRITIGNEDYYEVSGKLTADTWQQARTKLGQVGHESYIMFESGKGKMGSGNYSSRQKVTYEDSTYNEQALTLKGVKNVSTTKTSIEIYNQDDEYKGLDGFFRIRVPATTDVGVDNTAMLQALNKMGLDDLAKSPTKKDEIQLKKSRLIWQHDPKTAATLSSLTPTERTKTIDKALAGLGFDDKRINDLEWKEVYPGYSTYVDPQAIIDYKNAGLTHVWAGVGSKEAVVAISKNGFTATNYRIQSGMPMYGASPLSDMETGGSDSVFTRIGVATQNDRYRDNFLGGAYRFIMKPEIMGRTDWYAYNGDYYGTVSSLGSRLKPETHIYNNSKVYSSNNEIMFRHGIQTENFLGISCQTEELRTKLLEEFKKSGVKKINGVKTEEFVHVSTIIGEDSGLNQKKGI